eukprot:14120408-Heterocapsa_arctica.AAC.1
MTSRVFGACRMPATSPHDKRLHPDHLVGQRPRRSVHSMAFRGRDQGVRPRGLRPHRAHVAQL